MQISRTSIKKIKPILEYRKAHLPRIASSGLRMNSEQKFHFLFEEMVRKSQLNFHQPDELSNSTSVILSRPQDFRLRIKGRTKFQPTRLTQRTEQDFEHEKQKIITNRTLLIKFAEKTRPTNASLSKRERLNMRLATNTITNSTKQSENLSVLDKILDAQNTSKLPTALEMELRNNISKRRALASKIQHQVKNAITNPHHNLSVLSL